MASEHSEYAFSDEYNSKVVKALQNQAQSQMAIGKTTVRERMTYGAKFRYCSPRGNPKNAASLDESSPEVEYCVI